MRAARVTFLQNFPNTATPKPGAGWVSLCETPGPVKRSKTWSVGRGAWSVTAKKEKARFYAPQALFFFASTPYAPRFTLYVFVDVPRRGDYALYREPEFGYERRR
jgi:hypothetical protein